jgi:hypothetical protein
MLEATPGSMLRAIDIWFSASRLSRFCDRIAEINSIVHGGHF